MQDMLNITDEQRQQLATMHHLYYCASQQLNDERQALLLGAMVSRASQIETRSCALYVLRV
jgi:hypothetical protein